MEKRRKTASESLRALHEFLLEPEEDIRTVPLETIKAELKREGIDTDPFVREIHRRIAHAHGADRLQKARADKTGLLSKLAETSAVLGETMKRTRDETLALIRALSQRHPALAGVQFRKLDLFSDEDLEQLLRDMEVKAALDEADDSPQHP